MAWHATLQELVSTAARPIEPSPCMTSGFSMTLLASVSSTVFREAHLQTFRHREKSPLEGVTAPLLPSLTHPKLLSQTKGPQVASFPEAGPAQVLVASHSLHNKILQAPSWSHRFRSEPSFVEWKAIKMQSSLEVVLNTPTFIYRFPGKEVCRCSQEKKGWSREN